MEHGETGSQAFAALDTVQFERNPHNAGVLRARTGETLGHRQSTMYPHHWVCISIFVETFFQQLMYFDATTLAVSNCAEGKIDTHTHIFFILLGLEHSRFCGHLVEYGLKIALHSLQLLNRDLLYIWYSWI